MAKTTNQWLTERCLICDSVNHIFLSHPNPEGWECWNCLNRWWICDSAKIAYMFVNELSEEEANKNLQDGEVIFLNGQYTRW